MASSGDEGYLSRIVFTARRMSLQGWHIRRNEERGRDESSGQIQQAAAVRAQGRISVAVAVGDRRTRCSWPSRTARW